MPVLFSVDPSDVEILGSVDLVRLLNQLITAELYHNHISQAQTQLNLRVDDPDGGVDAWVQWSDGTTSTRHLPGRLCGFQSKAGDRISVSDSGKELLLGDESDLKPRVKAILEAGGAYVLFSSADMNELQKTRRIERMQTAASPHLSGATIDARIYAATDIAVWASEYLWTRTFLIRAAGRAHPDLLQTIEEWSNLARLQNQYTWTDQRRVIAAALRASAETPGGSFRLNGSPGLGKTRLALEALRPLSLIGNSVVYFDAAYPGTELSLLNALPNWRRTLVRGVLVVDNCSLELHEKIRQELAASAASTVTIDYERTGVEPNTATLEPLANHAIEQILRSEPRQLPFAALQQIIQFAEGWPLMALRSLEALFDERGTIPDVTDQLLLKRMVTLRDYAEGEQVLRALSLFSYVGYLEERAGEYEAVRGLLTPDISRDRFYEIARRYQERGTIIAVGRYWRVTPPPLAIRLTHEWLAVATPETLEALFGSALPESLKPALAQRFSDLGSSPHAVAIVERLTVPGGRFGTLEGILGRNNSEMFRSLAEVAPAAGTAALKRLILPMNDDGLRQLDNSKGRQNLVFALEALAFHRTHFRDAALMLFALARVETSPEISNNSGGTLVKLFAPTGSQTEATPGDRIAVLDEMVARDDEQSIDLSANAIAHILSSGQSYVILGPESQGGRKPLEEWRPKTWREVSEYWALGMERLIILGRKNAFARTKARHVFETAIRLLVASKQWETLARGLHALMDPRPWSEAIGELRMTLIHELSQEAETDRQHVTELLNELEPTTLDERTKAFVIEPPNEIEMHEGRIYDRAAERAREFAQCVAAAGSAREVLNLISSGRGRLAFEFGQAIAEHMTDLRQVADEALAALREAPEPRNSAALAGIAAFAFRAAPDVRTFILDTIAADERLREHLPMLTMIPEAQDSDIPRLMHALAQPSFSEPNPMVFTGRGTAVLSTQAAHDLLELLLSRKWYRSAFSFLLLSSRKEAEMDDLTARAIIESNFVASPLPGFLDSGAMESAKRLAGGDGPEQFAVELARQLVAFSLTRPSFMQQRRAAALWPSLLGRHQSAVWSVLKEAYFRLDKRARLNFLWSMEYLRPGEIDHRNALEDLSAEEMIEFAKEDSDIVPWFLARNAKIVEQSADGTLAATAILLWLLEHFGTRDDVLENIEANLRSFLSVGPRAVYYQKRIEFIEKLPMRNHQKTQDWKTRMISNLTSERDRYRQRDEEHERGIF